jgi:class 3 adenylate cyclase
MAGLLIHAVVYLAINGLLVAVWVLTAGSADELRAVVDRPAESLELGFWPVWPILGWGVALVVHTVVALVGLPGRAGRHVAGRRVDTDVAATPAVVRDAQPRKRWVVVMFTDICDSTARNEQMGDEAWHGVLARYRDLVRAAVSSRGGHEVATAGDGFLVRFESPADAVLAGVDIQQALADARSADATTPHTRIGLHAGDAVDAGDDVLGHVVNLAARVSSAAEPDEILVTEPVADQLVGSLQVEDRGLQPLKGVSQPRHLLAVRWDDAPPVS